MPHLSASFLAPYYKSGDRFDTLLARAVYLSKYCREGESWTGTIKRCVEANTGLDPHCKTAEAEDLFDTFWKCKSLPPGRGLWTGGVHGIPVAARYNCYFTAIRSLEDWCFVADMLMLGGGVGVGLTEIDQLPVVRRDLPAYPSIPGVSLKSDLSVICAAHHPDGEEVQGDELAVGMIFPVPDSREGWIEAIRKTLHHAFAAQSLTLNVSDIRAKGQPIKTFGGIAPGPGPLVDLLRALWHLIRGAAGRKLSSVEALDITNHIGKCVKSGNVRRSAILTVGAGTDQAFRDAKKDLEAVISHRHTSNNSVLFDTAEELENFDWLSLAWDNVSMGEPGIFNRYLARKTDPDVLGVNPCGEVMLEDKEACNLVEAFPARCRRSEMPRMLELVTRYALRQRLEPLTHPKADEVRKKNMRLGVAIGGWCDFEATPEEVRSWYRTVRYEADEYADELEVNRPNKVTTCKPSGTISLLAGSSPGAHAPFAPYYIRTIRLGKNEPIAQSLIEARVPCEDDVTDPKNKYVFSFPMKAAHTRKTVQTESTRDQFDRLLAIQENWSDNAVSITITFDNGARYDEATGTMTYDPDKVQALADLLHEYASQVKSLSLLAKAHGYQQAVYQEITEQEYYQRTAQIDMSAKLVHGSEFEFEECAGACPMR